MSRGGGINPFKWDQMEKLLGSKLPALPSAQQMDMLNDTSWVEDYVQQVLTKSMPVLGSSNKRSAGSAEVFDTHNYVIVKVKMSDQKCSPTVKVRVDQVRFDGMENGTKKIVPLPCHVIPHTSRSSFKDGILQVKMRKKKINKTYYEIPIRYL
ncbi:Hsp20/alpha crystallin family protein [Paenibacillus rigui]|uniref:SHSP domain-containing protein n=1 Tax=Paenibacillus rigui TaxID=554312 RepID=A0A229UN60_9BACL|nr:Hsp20/alpha crystallin family protein [Paenibacillus rigui]OXM84754.1 hypothetical protein CF651_19820 [Paenibacillus rigui]